MRLRNVKNKDYIIKNSKILIENPREYIGKWSSVFGNDHEIHVEIGMGKGKFIIEMAKQYPNINFIGIEKYDSVIVRALEKIEELPNLRMIRMNALEIDSCFQKEVSRIYLNFSDPWPKKRHHERRLTSFVFLEKYDPIFQKDCSIVQKTDNRDLFEYSLLSLSNFGYIFQDLSLDLYTKDICNVSTEYEERFHKLGCPIYYVCAFKNSQTDQKNLK